MGSRGPIPKRSSQTRRANKKDVTEAPAGSRAARPDEPPRSGKGSTTEAWITYARSLGHDVDDDASRAEAMALVDEGLPSEEADGWHPIARDWYESLARSGQSVFYEPSDWATARLIAEAMSRELKPQPIGVDDDGQPILREKAPTGAAISSWMKAMAVLLVTEGDRRRVQVELERTSDEQDDADVSDLDVWRRRLRSG